MGLQSAPMRAIHIHAAVTAWVCAAVFGLASVCACKTSSSPTLRSVEDAWAGSNAQGSLPATRTSSAAEDVIARVNGVPVSRRSLIEPLLEGHGVGLFEQLVVLKAAEDAARRNGLTVTSADIDAEYRRSLESITGQVASSVDSLGDEAAESLLDEVLARRNLSRAEYMPAIRRNAYLRKLAGRDIVVSKEDIQAEFERTYGDRVEIRHIQCASESEIGEVAQRLSEGGAFSELAARYSANHETARKGGLLPPFSRNDPEIPERLRDAAFALEAGRVSQPVLVDGWYHMIQVERYIPAAQVGMDQVRSDVEQTARDRLTEAAMQRLAVELFDAARVEVFDPTLRALFRKKHGIRASDR